MALFVDFFKGKLKETAQTCWILFKIMIPVSILIKVLELTGSISYIGNILAPFMKVVGLPGEYAIVWGTGIITNLYGGILAFVSISSTYPLTVAQATILTTMMLVAHNFFVELKIATQSGVRFFPIFAIRFFGAVFIGMLLNMVYTMTNAYQNPSSISWVAKAKDPSLFGWLKGELSSYAKIFVIVFILIMIIYILKRLGVMDFFIRSLDPILKILGIGGEVAHLTVIGMTLGLAYGGGLIIKEAQAGHIARRDIFFAMALMGLCHSVVEDTLLMMSLGASITGVLLMRVIVAMVATWALVKWVGCLSNSTVERFLIHPEKGTVPCSDQ